MLYVAFASSCLATARVYCLGVLCAKHNMCKHNMQTTNHQHNCGVQFARCAGNLMAIADAVLCCAPENRIDGDGMAGGRASMLLRFEIPQFWGLKFTNTSGTAAAAAARLRRPARISRRNMPCMEAWWFERVSVHADTVRRRMQISRQTAFQTKHILESCVLEFFGRKLWCFAFVAHA